MGKKFTNKPINLGLFHMFLTIPSDQVFYIIDTTMQHHDPEESDRRNAKNCNKIKCLPVYLSNSNNS